MLNKKMQKTLNEQINAGMYSKQIFTMPLPGKA